MNLTHALASVRGALRNEMGHLTRMNHSDRPWQMPLAAALATGLPLIVGAGFGRMDFGLVSSIGGLAFLYLPATPLYHRMVQFMACAFAITACYALGALSHFVPVLMVPALIFITALVTMLCRLYAVGPPGSIFFVMAAAIGVYSPLELLEVPRMTGLMAMGSTLAGLIAFAYSVYMLRRRDPQVIAPLPRPTFEFVVFDSIVIGLCVGASLAIAQLLQLERAYWVPVSCVAVIQGVSLRAVWNKQLHRILGTAAGLMVAWGLLLLPLNAWTISLAMMALTFVIETLVVRHYALAAIFITPLTILLADAARLGEAPITTLIQARLFDTVLGSFVGLIGGLCLHSPGFRARFGPPLRRMLALTPFTRPGQR